ncbi:hypothetical protein [Thermosynechococcus sp. FA-CM-4201]
MNLLKKLFGAIFGLFGAIAKLFGLGKKGEFYIELDESTAAPPTPTKAAEPAPTPEPAPQPAQPVATAPTPVATAPAEPTPAPEPTPVTPSVPYTRFARRRPGANMAAFLNMARQVRPST